MQKFGTGQILNDEDQPVRKTANARPLTEDDVQEIEREGQNTEE
jgi:hypothetical protein